MFHALERTKGDSMRFLSRYSKGMRFKTYEFFISEIFYLIFLDYSSPWLTTGNLNHREQTHGQGERLYIGFLILAI